MAASGPQQRFGRRLCRAGFEGLARNLHRQVCHGAHPAGGRRRPKRAAGAARFACPGSNIPPRPPRAGFPGLCAVGVAGRLGVCVRGAVVGRLFSRLRSNRRPAPPAIVGAWGGTTVTASSHVKSRTPAPSPPLRAAETLASRGGGATCAARRCDRPAAPRAGRISSARSWRARTRRFAAGAPESRPRAGGRGRALGDRARLDRLADCCRYRRAGAGSRRAATCDRMVGGRGGRARSAGPKRIGAPRRGSRCHQTMGRAFAARKPAGRPGPVLSRLRRRAQQ